MAYQRFRELPPVIKAVQWGPNKLSDVRSMLTDDQQQLVRVVNDMLQVDTYGEWRDVIDGEYVVALPVGDITFITVIPEAVMNEGYEEVLP